MFRIAVLALAAAVVSVCSSARSDDADEWSREFLFAPAYTIAGGTSEVIKDGIAERTLGLPRHKV